MATDAVVSQQAQTPRKMRVNDDGSHTPYVVAEPAGGGADSDVNLDQVGGAPFGLGQANKAASIPVVQAADSDYLDIPFTTNGVTGAQVLLADTDVSQYSSLQIVWNSVGGGGLAGTVQFAPVAGGTYVSPATFQNRANVTAVPAVSAVAVNTIYESPIVGAFMRLNITALTSGTATGFIRLHKRPMVYAAPAISTVNSVTGFGAGTNGPMKAEDAASATGDQGVAVMGIRRDTPVANDNVSADGDYTTFKTDNFGMMWVNSRNAPVGTRLNTYAGHITTNATTTPTAATAYISSITISVPTAGTGSTITIQDKSGTPLKVINLKATAVVTDVPIVINFQTPILATGGIDIITTGAGAATCDVWIDYYQ